ncbi:MAG: HEAT repeat domain-containing protein, partial [Ilyomonas sp.]
MKKILLALIALTISGSMAIAQTNSDHRTLNTRVADLLAQLPAKNSAQLAINMKEIAAIGKDGLVEIAGMLVAPGTGDNSNPQFALNSFSYYVTQPGKESWRQMSEQAYCLALEKATNKENKAFIISQLQIVGQNDKVVTCLQPYLKDEQLCDPAARALIKINTPAANNTLLQAAQNAQGTCLLSVVEALGDTRNTAAVPVITPLVNKGDKALTKVALYALAAIADPSSAAILTKAARESGFTYDQTNATDSYLFYMNRLAENGNRKLSAELAKSLLKEANQDEQVHTRIAAMKLFAGMQGDK